MGRRLSTARVHEGPARIYASPPCHSLRSRSQGNPDCGRRTSTIAASFLIHPLSEVAWSISTARLHRAPSERARWASKEMTRLSRVFLTASHSPHTPSQLNNAPPHRHRVDQVQAVCRRRQPTQ